MKIERLRNKKSKLIFLCGFLMVVVLLVTLVFKGSKAKYRSSQIIPLINTKVKNNVPSFTTMGIFLEDSTGTEIKNGKKYKKQESSDKMPGAGYVINKTNSYCEKFDTTQNKSVTNTKVKLFTNEYGQHIMYGLSKGDKCYIYLDKGTVAIKNLLAQWGYPDITEITERPASDFTTKTTKIGRDTTNDRDYVYKALDDDGTSYYLAGNPKYNWVKFGGHYWRIVRINGDGTLRMIYSGTAKAEEKGPNTKIGTSKYNTEIYDSISVGYWYVENDLHGLANPSSVYTEVNNFYKNNLASENIDKYIDKNSGFCNDRTLSSYEISDSPGYGAWKVTYTAVYDRLVRNLVPKLTCTEKDTDLFTTQTGKLNGKGNGVLEYPIGLITTDELILAGLTYYGAISINDNYLLTGENYWTMSPSGRNGGHAVTIMFDCAAAGYVGANNLEADNGIRPVISLKKDITFSKGNGSISSPFEI